MGLVGGGLSAGERVFNATVAVAMLGAAAVFGSAAIADRAYLVNAPALPTPPALSAGVAKRAAGDLGNAYPGLRVEPVAAPAGLIVASGDTADFHIFRAAVLSAEAATGMPLAVQTLCIGGLGGAAACPGNTAAYALLVAAKAAK